MREIKFRAWVLRDWALDGLMENMMEYDVESFHDPLYEYKQGNIILMQYTGLKDKNGKEIYERDIVDTVYDGELFTGVVVYDESELDFKATNGKENYGSNFQYLPCCEEVEVIGNAYENPELLNC